MPDRREGVSEQGQLPGRPTPVRDSGGPRPFSGKWVGGGPNSALRIWLQVWYVFPGPILLGDFVGATGTPHAAHPP